jgi:DNA-binding transcriptional regulator of glucitol operon
VLRRYRFALRPGWILLHLFTVALVVTMILLGRWQLHVSESKHFSLQNFGYSIQWWLFSAFALVFWWRIVRDGARRRAEASDPTPAEPAAPSDTPVAYRRYVMPTAPQPTNDPMLAAYNDYLASLAAEDAERAREQS